MNNKNMISGRLFVHGYRPQAMLKISGDDALSFLQGQFTNELRQAPGAATYGLWLNQKGRVIADSHVLRLGDSEFFLVSVLSRNTDVRSRLESYIIADDVVLTDETATTHGLVLGGPGCGEIMRQVFGASPEAGRFERSGEILAFRGRRIREENFELIGPEKSLTELREKFIAFGCLDAGKDELQLAQMQAGIPAIPQDLGPDDLPNEGGLEESAISYTKGCYLGQEVMARLKNRGQVRRRLHVIEGKGAVPQPRASLYQGLRKAGEIRSVVGHDNGFIAWAMLSLVGLDPEAGLSLAPGGPAGIRINAHG